MSYIWLSNISLFLYDDDDDAGGGGGGDGHNHESSDIITIMTLYSNNEINAVKKQKLTANEIKCQHRTDGTWVNCHYGAVLKWLLTTDIEVLKIPQSQHYFVYHKSNADCPDT
jgi:hypothetical protein